MCVLTYYPTCSGGYILTSNRDENVKRVKATIPKQWKIGNVQVVAPIDPQSEGTWIATSRQYTAVLLNGGLTKHVPCPPYKHSRGRVILDFFKFNDPQKFSEQYDFEGIEPFTILIFKGDVIWETRWCGAMKHLKYYNEKKPMIWSSVTLYDQAAIAKREKWFFDYLKSNDQIETQTLLDFNINGGKEDPKNSILLNRDNELKSLSTVQIVQNNLEHSIQYIDHQLNENLKFRIF